MQKACNFCQAIFETSDHRKKYCTLECTNNGRNTLRRAKAAAHKQVGICPYCHFRPLAENGYGCQTCMDRIKAAKDRQHKERKIQRLCRDCGSSITGDGLYCTPCVASNNRRAKILVEKRVLNQKCHTCGGALSASSTTKSCSHCLAKANQKNDEVRKKVFEHYGIVCACCGEKNMEFLIIDHVSNDGAKHRKITKGAGVATYKWLIKNDFPPGFQTLCFNCNQAKHLNGGACPCNSPLTTDLNSYYNRIKLQIISHYGEKCACCQETKLWFLSIDHILGDGHVKRKAEGTGMKLYLFLKRNNFPPGYQVLCHNCNSSKGITDMCAHKRLFANIRE